MTQNQTALNDGPGSYQIGAVCNLTGISHHVLRVWEKRYSVVQPERQPNGRRLYSESDVRKLSLLKSLVDRGHGIGSIAQLSVDELEARLDQVARIGEVSPSECVPAVIFIGGGLLPGRKIESLNARFEVAAQYSDLEQALKTKPRPKAQIAVLEWPSLLTWSAIEINRVLRILNLNRVLLIYDYASESALNALNAQRVSAVQGPMGPEVLDAIIPMLCRTVSPAAQTDLPPPARQFDDAALSRVAVISSEVRCECPRHLAQIVMKLVRFEDYSADCENLNREDAELHAYLYRVTGQARSEMERALGRVLEAESLLEAVQAQRDEKDD